MAEVVTIVLAAGQGSRLGGPKALLRVARGELEMPLVEAQCRDRLEAESARALAVLRPEVAVLVSDRLRDVGAEVVVSRAPEELGPAGSLAAAAAHLAQVGGLAGLRAVVITPVDVRVEAATVAALVAALEAAGPGAAPLAVVPRFEGRRGHPVALRPAALERYREGDPPPLREHLRSLGDRAVALDVADPFVVQDLNRADPPELLARITGARAGVLVTPRFFGGPTR